MRVGIWTALPAFLPLSTSLQTYWCRANQTAVLLVLGRIYAVLLQHRPPPYSLYAQHTVCDRCGPCTKAAHLVPIHPGAAVPTQQLLRLHDSPVSRGYGQPYRHWGVA